MTSQKDNPKLTITLTARRPVTIHKEDWPILAEATEFMHDGQVEYQANVRTRWALRVRQHADGRIIVYGTYSHQSQFQGARNYQVRGGELLPGDVDLPAAVTRVGRWMEKQMPSELPEDQAEWTRLINACIADLPAEEL